MSNYDSNSDWCSFFNSDEEVNEIEIKDIILEYCNNETESINKDQIKWRDFKDYKDAGINFRHSIKLV